MANINELAAKLCSRIAKNNGAAKFSTEDQQTMIHWLKSPYAAGENDPLLVEKNYAAFASVLKRTCPTSVNDLVKALLATDGL